MATDPATTTVNVAISRYGMRPRVGIAAIIDRYAARIRSISNCAKEHIQFARENTAGWANRASKQLPTSVVGYANNSLVVDNRFHEDLANHLLTEPSQILGQALLIAGFSTFDAFLGSFLGQLYREERSKLWKLEDREVKLSEIIDCVDIDEALDGFVHRNVSNLIRESYTKIFANLAKWHDLKTLEEFAAWPAFIEASQRRHLFTHCDGVVSTQYLDVCKSAKCKLDPSIVVGKKLDVEPEYLSSTLDILYEVIVMLGITLWRTASDRFVEPAGVFLTDEIFTLLDREQWGLAKTLGKFAVGLPDQKSDLQAKISRINYAQAMKWSGDQDSAIKILAEIDWSGSIRDLRLGVEVIRERYDNAASLMRQIGKEGEQISRTSYRIWPIFREFRKTDQFKAAFQEIYGAPFADDSYGTQIMAHAAQQAQVQPIESTTEETSMPSGKPVEFIETSIEANGSQSESA